MNNKIEQIQQWASAVEKYEPVSWERMPEIDLYMDQVITYMDKQLALYRRTEQTKMLTSSMINNYVKDELLPRPEQKKYSREHLAGLMMICLLKQVLSIPDIAGLLNNMRKNAPMDEIYDNFITAQDAVLKKVSLRAQRVCENDTEDELRRLAMDLTLEANAYRIAAEKILSALEGPEAEKGKREKEAQS